MKAISGVKEGMIKKEKKDKEICAISFAVFCGFF